MLATLVLAVTIAGQAEAVVLKATSDVATAREVVRTCWTPRECIVASEMLAAAKASLAAANRAAGVCAPEVQPFADMTVYPPFAGTPFPGGDEVAEMIREGEALAKGSQ